MFLANLIDQPDHFQPHFHVSIQVDLRRSGGVRPHCENQGAGFSSEAADGDRSGAGGFGHNDPVPSDPLQRDDRRIAGNRCAARSDGADEDGTSLSHSQLRAFHAAEPERSQHGRDRLRNILCRSLPRIGCVAVHLDAVLVVDVEAHRPSDVPQLHVVVSRNVVGRHLDLPPVHIDGGPGRFRRDSRGYGPARQHSAQGQAGEHHAHIPFQMAHIALLFRSAVALTFSLCFPGYFEHNTPFPSCQRFILFPFADKMTFQHSPFSKRRFSAFQAVFSTAWTQILFSG